VRRHDALQPEPANLTATQPAVVQHAAERGFLDVEWQGEHGVALRRRVRSRQRLRLVDARDFVGDVLRPVTEPSAPLREFAQHAVQVELMQRQAALA